MDISRDQDSFSIFANISPGEHFNPMSWGDSESAFKSTSVEVSINCQEAF